MSWWDDLIGDVGWQDVVSTGFDIAGALNKNNAGNNFADILAQQEKNNYDTSKANYDAYNEYLANVYGPNAAAERAAAQANANARASAARQNEANRVRSEKKAGKKMTKFYKQGQAMIDPFIKAGQEVAPANAQNYLDATAGLKNLRGYLESPSMMAMLGNPRTPTMATDIGKLPDYLKKK